MKRILVPTDFSEHANNALRYAINIGNYFEAEIELLHIYEMKAIIGSTILIREYLKEAADRDLADNIRSFKDLIFGKTILHGRALDGNPIDAICSIANNEDFDMIVMGTQGASGLKEIFLGSKTSGVMQQTRRPILAIPNSFTYRPIKDVTFAVDSGIVADDEVLHPLLELAKGYKSNIKILHLDKEKMVVGYDPGIGISLGSIPHSFHRISGANDVNGMINLFVFEENSDLLCMIRRERDFWSNLFHRSVTTKEVFDSPVPLLILRDVALK
ncbi:MAG: nucleotide-binding universal stress UspA family protein [Granulosicoccus sp.]|jgi:nucleotide-binding universal stress UspA family protein